MDETTKIIQKRIGSLIRDRRKQMGESLAALAERAGINSKTLWSAEKGERIPHDVNQLKIEMALEWREGSIAEVLEQAAVINVDTLTLQYMREPHRAEPLTTAKSLSDEELLAELAYRFRNYGNSAAG
jgi:transcriptional regulator with XRE-family HTH domain